MAELLTYPDTDLAGSWELTEPLPVDGAGYQTPLLVGSDSAAYSAEDSAAAAAQPAALTLPTVLADDIAVVITAVTDGTTSIELTGADAPTVAGTDEVQTITSYLTSGTFTITYDGQTTGTIAWDAAAAAIETALEALSNIAVGEATVSGGPLDGAGALVTVTFSGALAATDLTEMTCSVAYVAPVNEVQTLSSDRTGGTFTLTHATNTTAAIAWNATAATVQTELEALAHLDAGDVLCSGGGLPTDIVITFAGAQAATDVGDITVTDSGTGGTAVTIAQTTTGVPETGQVLATTIPGVAERAFALDHSINIPRGAADEPQIHVWWLKMVAADSLKTLDITVADHDTLHSWAANVLVYRYADTTNPLETLGTEVSGEGSSGIWGTVTPATSGSIVLAIASKALPLAYYTTASEISIPVGYEVALQVAGDAITLAVFSSGPLSVSAEQPESATWGTTEDYALGLVSIKPATASSSGANLYAVVNATDITTWIEIGTAAGSMYEVLELDLSSLPSGAVLTGIKLDVAHQCSVKNRLRVVAVGINADDTIERGAEQQLGYLPVPVGVQQSILTGFWYKLNGERISTFNRLGVALFSSDRHPALQTHQIYWVQATIEYEAGGPVVSAVVGPASPGADVTWTYSSGSGLPQSHYQVMIVEGSAQDPDLATAPDNPLSPATGEIVFDSGQVAGDLDRALSIVDKPLGRGTQTVAVRSWATLASGESVASAWDEADFDISGVPATTPTQTSTPAFDTSSGGVDVEIIAPAAVSRAWLYRSEDSGVTWGLAGDSPYTITPSSTQTIVDYSAPFQATALRYEVSFDAGSMTETSTPEESAGGDITTPAGAWYLLAQDDPTLNTVIQVRDVSVDNPIKATTAEQPGNSVSATSLPLATRISLVLWIMDADEKAAVFAILSSGLLLRLVDIWGQSWTVRNVTGIGDAPQRWRALPSETTGIRDGRFYSVDFIEETAT